MVRLILVLFFLFSSLHGLNFTVASYNIENLFDLKNDGTEYKEYIPCSKANPHLQNTKYWNKQTLQIKLQNITKVINDLNADIIALQEVESKEALELLHKRLSQYKYKAFIKNKHASVGIAILSKYKIIDTKKIEIDKYDKFTRPILAVTIKIKNKNLKLFVNHWRSKRAKENTRTKYAVALKNEVFSLSDNEDYILLGDFNSNYNEYKTFKNNKKLNNTYGITGINHIINTIENDKFVLQNNIHNYKQKVHYNLWLELKKEQRFSYKYRGNNNTPDNILLPASLFDNKNISYIDDSFKVFKPNYIYKNNKINRWKKNKGYSDHLPIVASFTTNKVYKQKTTQKENLKKQHNIEYLYNIEHITKPISLKDVIVIYKHKNSAILKQNDGRAIYAYNCANNLKLGFKYNLIITKIENYNDLLEIKNISHSKRIKSYPKYKQLYKDATKIDIFNTKYTNEIITKLKGIYKKGYLYLPNKQKINLYFPRNFKKPKKNGKITINSGHLGIYKGKVQILIHKQSDITSD